MTVEEMHAEVLLEIDRVGSYSTSNLISGEIDNYLNQAQRRFVNQNRRFLREYSSIPEGTEAHENLRTIEENETISSGISSVTGIPNGFELDLTSLANTYDYYISGISYFSTPDHRKSHRLVNKSYINTFCETLDNQNPVYSKTPVTINNDKLIGLYGVRDKKIPDEITIDYLKKFQDVSLNSNTDSELPNDTHKNIVDIAVQLIIQSLSGQQQRNNQEE